MASEKITMYRTNADKTEVIEQLPKTVTSHVYDGSNNQFLDRTMEQVTQQLVKINEKVSVSPDDFEGTDIQKLQQCVDIGKTSGVTINLNRVFNITGGSINVDKGYNNWIDFTAINGGGLTKTDVGFIFTSSFDNIQRGNMTFEGLVFRGNISFETHVVNADRIIRLYFNKCHFYNINAVKAETRYLQTLRFFQNEVYDHLGYFIDVNYCYDMQITHNQIEACDGGGFLRAGRTNRADFSTYLLNFSYNLAEGYQNYPILTIGDSAIGVNVNNNYFEYIPHGAVEFFRTNSTAKIRTFDFSNNFVSSDNAVAIVGASLLNYLATFIFENNTLSGVYGFDTVNNQMKVTHRDTNAFYFKGGITGKLFKDNNPAVTIRDGITDNHGTVAVTYVSGEGTTFTVSNFFVADNTSYAGESLLVSVSTTHPNNLYKSQFTGLLSFTGMYDGTRIVIKANLTPLFDEIGGVTTGTSNVTATFGNGTVTESNSQGTFADKRLIIKVGNGYSANGKLSIVPLSQALKAQQSYLYRNL